MSNSEDRIETEAKSDREHIMDKDDLNQAKPPRYIRLFTVTETQMIEHQIRKIVERILVELFSGLSEHHPELECVDDQEEK